MQSNNTIPSYNCFNNIDVRGKFGESLTEEIAYRIARAFATIKKTDKVVVGSDNRLSSPALKRSVIQGLCDSGTSVIDLGTTGTEEVYFATVCADADGGIQITASHNPKEYNGLKMVGRNSIPLTPSTGIMQVKALAEKGTFSPPTKKGSVTYGDYRSAYVDNLFKNCDTSIIKPLTIVTNAGNGVAGKIIDMIYQKLLSYDVPIILHRINHKPDGSFPNGVPNPLLQENRHETSQAVREYNADLGIAWDGDFDRCFFFDESGDFVESYYIISLFAEHLLRKNPKDTIVYDPRLIWNTIDTVNELGGKTICSRTGHAFIKECMRREGAVYGGEMSAHHYFREFNYCDSGMLPWIILLEILGKKNCPLSKLIDTAKANFPCSGELNFITRNGQRILKQAKEVYGQINGANLDERDGLSIEFQDWRFNLRSSNTEPYLRLNVETRGLPELLKTRVDEISQFISKF